MDDARKINQVPVRGKYGSQAERYWSVLRASINDLARCYNLTPLGGMIMKNGTSCLLSPRSASP